MSLTIIELYSFCCDKCGIDQVEEHNDLPYGWEDVDGYDLCDSCFIEYDLLESEEDKEEFMENVPI